MGLMKIMPSAPERAIPDAAPVEYAGLTNRYLPKLKPYDDDQEIMRAFDEEIRDLGGAEARGNTARQRHVIEIIEKIYASSRSGAAQEVAPL